uniref:Uncharacterized protein n=1 Tax=Triticum aestivum TaxID=4565 RepID=A0A077RPL7_WHEAT|nr:unnamed protein product [Triticum aestivum]
MAPHAAAGPDCCRAAAMRAQLAAPAPASTRDEEEEEALVVKVKLLDLFLGGNSDSCIWMLVGRLHPAASWSCKPVVVVVGDGDAATALFFGGSSDGSMMVRKLCPAGWSWTPVVVIGARILQIGYGKTARYTIGRKEAREGPTDTLLEHFAFQHKWPCTTIKYYDKFHLEPGLHFFRTKERENFLLNVALEPIRHAIFVVCIQPKVTNSKFKCQMSYCCFTPGYYQSSMYKIRSSSLFDGYT